MKAELNPLCSISLSPAIVHPLGIQFHLLDVNCFLAIMMQLLLLFERPFLMLLKHESQFRSDAALIDLRKKAIPHAHSAVADVIFSSFYLIKDAFNLNDVPIFVWW